MKKNRSKPSILLVVKKIKQNERMENTNIIEYDERILKKLDRKYETSYDYIIFSAEINTEIKFNNYVLVYNNQNKKVFMNLLILNTILINNIENIIENGQIEVVSLVRYIQINEIKQDEFIFNNVIRKIKKENKLKRKEIRKYKRIIVQAIRGHYSQGSMVRNINFHLKKIELY